jgi:hypothetical protein
MYRISTKRVLILSMLLVLLILSRITTTKADRVVTLHPAAASPLVSGARRGAVEPVASIRAATEGNGARGAPAKLGQPARESGAITFVALETLAQR